MQPRERRRITRVVGYSLMAVAGVVAIAWPAPSVQVAASGSRYLAIVWAAMLAVGGICSALGAVTDRWLGEYAGLWPMAATFFVYALTVGVTATTNARPSSFAVAAVFGAIGCLLISRWRDVAAVRVQATRRVRGHDGW